MQLQCTKSTALPCGSCCGKSYCILDQRHHACALPVAFLHITLVLVHAARSWCLPSQTSLSNACNGLLTIKVEDGTAVPPVYRNGQPNRGAIIHLILRNHSSHLQG